MRFHPKAFVRALIVLSGFATLLLLGMDAKAGVTAILAVTAVDALSFLLPLGVTARRDARDREKSDPRIQ